MLFEHVLKAMSGCSAFDDLTTAERGLLLMMAKPRRLAKGEMLYRKGEKGTDSFVLLVEGELNVLADANGEPLFTKSAGELVGEMGRLNPHKERTKSVVASTAGAALLEWSFPALEKASPGTVAKLVERFEQIAFERLAQDFE